MAITRTDINGDIALLKAALETLVPDFFASVTYDDDSAPSAIICKDADGNTIFKAAKANATSGNWTYKAYKNDTTNISAGSTDNTSQPLYFYTVGGNGAVIQTRRNPFVMIAKTNNGKAGFVLPPSLTSSSLDNYTAVKTAYYGDDPALTGDLRFASTSANTDNIGNHTLFVPISMHGTYEEQVYLPKAFFMPMAQAGMRGVVQELTADEGTYLTNGYVALLDD